MSLDQIRFYPAAPARILFLGAIAEVLTVGLAAWIWHAVSFSEATGGFRYIFGALLVAPVVGCMAIGSAVFGGRRVSLLFALLTIAALVIFSLSILFMFYSFPCIAMWVVFARGVFRSGSKVPARA